MVTVHALDPQFYVEQARIQGKGLPGMVQGSMPLSIVIHARTDANNLLL